MASISEIRLYDLFEDIFQNSKDTFLTKPDKIELIDRIADVRLEIGNVKTSLIAWMFAFWLGQVAVIIGIVSYMMKK